MMFGNYKSYLKRHYHLPCPTTKEIEEEEDNLFFVANTAIVTAVLAVVTKVFVGKNKQRKVA